MNRIHYRCRCTGQEFTFDEWCARCREHDSALPLLNQMLTQIRKFKESYNPRQLTLFEI